VTVFAGDRIVMQLTSTNVGTPVNIDQVSFQGGVFYAPS
jgi:hypothetical protein